MVTNIQTRSTRKAGRSRGRWGVTRAALLLVGLLSIVALSGSSRAAPIEGIQEREAAQRIVDLTHAERLSHSLAGLSVDWRLTLAAERYAKVMGRQDWFGHLGPDGSTVDGRAEAAGYLGWTYLGENLRRAPGPWTQPISWPAG